MFPMSLPLLTCGGTIQEPRRVARSGQRSSQGCHFTDTSFIVRDEGRLVAFLIGFLSQSRPDEAYIHFVGVEPGYRGRGIGADLYERFFAVVRENRRRKVLAITSASNTRSQAFHRRMGFVVSEPITNYDGRGGAHVEFSRGV
jgi:ribosomal protein S18 acetylase RimI-like enzyme